MHGLKTASQRNLLSKRRKRSSVLTCEEAFTKGTNGAQLHADMLDDRQSPALAHYDHIVLHGNQVAFRVDGAHGLFLDNLTI